MPLYVITLPTLSYNRKLLSFVKRYSKQYKSICYVSLNKTVCSLKEAFEKEKIDSSFHFIDGITPRLFQHGEQENCTFIDPISNPSELAEAIVSVAMKQKPDLVLFDSISSLLLQQGEPETESLLEYVLSFFEKLDADCALAVLTEDTKRNVVKQIQMRASKVIEPSAKKSK